ncbi:alpha/beta fold hydrolase [Kutzneria kofuensis]|uniref:Pimeloyl-ACP methyl ester carboxylesterase n=1 Tax=Kutzneria kofuensis TaxID=103725 RepID=A0A7W9NF57_9PSEU|nr:alpha/beta fold hydrolase [Kutzneria kofuensis]MBB5889761.1 pimeloyl-ACP methyl ester carboxylesterase [Kutzneria kofuensis]
MLVVDLPTVRVGDVTIAYRETGTPDGPPVVLLHAMASSGGTWRRLAACLPDRRVILPDLRGHGRSSRAADYTLAGFRDDMVGLLDELGLDRVDLVGHSLGGRIASMIALDSPARVRRLVLEDTPPPPHEPGPPPTRSLAELVTWRAFDRSMVRPVITQLRTPDPYWWSRLPAVAAPTLLVHGGPTSHVRLDHLTEMTRRLPNGRLVAIAAGHRVHSRCPAQFRDLVVPFLQSRDTW